MDKCFGKASAAKNLEMKELDKVCSEVLKVPNIFRKMLFTRIEATQKNNTGRAALPKVNGETKVSRAAF